MVAMIQREADEIIENAIARCPPTDFALPPDLEAAAPPETRGVARDGVRLMISYRSDDRVVHARFRDLPQFLDAGDLVVVNTSATMNAALPATRSDGATFELHLSTRLPADLWIVELRRPSPEGTKPYGGVVVGETFGLPGGAEVTLYTPYAVDRRDTPAQSRLWIAALRLPVPLHDYLGRFGFPIRYGYVREQWPLAHYQTVFAGEPGSAEMPSAARPFTPALVTRLVAKGVQFAPLLLHTGVSSLEAHEPPYEEYYRVPADTARIVNDARAIGKRIIAVGTTSVRALETVTDDRGASHPGEGWTRLLITARRGVRAVDGLLTGLHEPQATHLAMLEAIAARRRIAGARVAAPPDACAARAHLQHAYDEALRERYLWHEFGDSHLLLP